MEVSIRRVKRGDEHTLAYIQTESWKAAFKDIVDADTLSRCTEAEKATDMYRGLLNEDKGNGYILYLDNQPHCIAYWDAARDEEFSGKAELICIHSLPDNWHKGYGEAMMKKILGDMEIAGFKEAVLWVFTDNKRARSFYEANGFKATEYKKPCLGTEEICYEKAL